MPHLILWLYIHAEGEIIKRQEIRTFLKKSAIDFGQYGIKTVHLLNGESMRSICICMMVLFHIKFLLPTDDKAGSDHVVPGIFPSPYKQADKPQPVKADKPSPERGRETGIIG